MEWLNLMVREFHKKIQSFFLNVSKTGTIPSKIPANKNHEYHTANSVPSAIQECRQTKNWMEKNQSMFKEKDKVLQVKDS